MKVIQVFIQFILLNSLIFGCSNNLPEIPSVSDQTLLTDVSKEAGLAGFRHDAGKFGQAWAPEIVGGGGGFIDYDNDGWQDILLIGGGMFRGRQDRQVKAVRLYKNQGNGVFTDVTDETGLGEVETYSIGLTIADYDNDGDQDFFVTTLYENLLFKNETGAFTEVGRSVGVAEPSGWSTSAMFLDADRDGRLDLFVGNYVDWSPEKDIVCAYEGEKVYCTPEEYTGISSSFFHQNSDGTFSDWTRRAGFEAGIDAAHDKALGVAALDLGNDGWPDLIVANDTQRDLLYVNNGDGTFSEQGIRSGIAFNLHGKARAGMGLDIGVVDESGQPSLFVGNFSDETVGVFRYTGNGLFMDRAATSKIGHPSLRTLTFGLFLFDVDLDQDLDLFTANGHVQPHIEKIQQGISFLQPAQLYLNDGNGSFEEVQDRAGVLTKKLLARGSAYADYDQDGDLDILITENDGPVHLWRNENQGSHVLRIQLVGTESNRDAIGGRVVIHANGKQQERLIRTGSSYLSQSEKTATFGLGSATTVDTLTVHWINGNVEQLLNVSANQEIRIIEGSKTFEPILRFETKPE